MKRGIIAAVFLLLCIGITAYEYIYITVNTDSFVTMLTTAENEIEHNEILSAEEISKRAEHRFEDAERMLNLFLIHSEVDFIAQNLSKLSRYAHAGSTAEFLATSSATKKALLSLSRSEAPIIENIL